VASRYGKSQGVAAVVTLIAVIGVLPYVALQLKAISATLEVFIIRSGAEPDATIAPIFGDMSLLVALILAFFAIIFGTRQVDTTEHQDGLMIAIAAESAVKLAAFLAVGVFAVWSLHDGPIDLIDKAIDLADVSRIFGQTPDWGLWFTMTLLSASAIVLLPRQFHVMVIENRAPADIRKAAWMFPLYLVAINLFVVPIALAGLIAFPAGTVDRDLTVLALPLSNGAGLVAIMALIGGLSAATAMVIVECVALAIMISNELVVPYLLRRHGVTASRDMSRVILFVRRTAIIIVLLLGYAYYRAAGDAALASIGLLAFAAIAQIAPAFFGGLYWSRATARGAIAGLLTGIVVWGYTLLLPSFGAAHPLISPILREGLLGLAWLKPNALFGLDLHPLMHGVLVSLTANVIAFVGFSLSAAPSAIERLQANLFVAPDGGDEMSGYRFWRAAITIDDLRQTVARYLGEDRTAAAFESYAASRGLPAGSRLEADPQAMRFAEHLLASAIGASSSRLVLSLMLKRRNLSSDAALRVLDEASAQIQQNRALLQHALDHAQQGMTVFDKDLQLLACNRAFRAIFDLPPEMVRPGTGLDEIVAYNAARGLYGDVDSEDMIATRVQSYISDTEPVRLRLPRRGMVIDIRSDHLPDGGRVTTYTDITESVAAEEALERANETLERRVAERTEELTGVNAALTRAKAEADEANLSKTRFLAAASHDILQPLNAARLYTSALVERVNGAEQTSLARNAEASLDAVEEILTALLDISRLDSGAMKADIGVVRISDLFRQLAIEFEPAAQEKDLSLVFMPCSLAVSTDRRLMRRLLQNLVSNAIKYTPSGRVLVGCRRRGDHLRIEVHDTGIGIPANRQKQIFREFQRLDQGAMIARGLGLGLSIVERISRVLGHRIEVRSTSGSGSAFLVTAPLAEQRTALSSLDVRAADARPVIAPLQGLVVLCIDNEPNILQGMRALLAGWGCTVRTAAGRKEALAELDADGRRPDAVVADYHLDKGDGLSLVKALRAMGGEELPAILLTADRTLALREKAGKANVLVLNKPLKPAALRAWLAQMRIRQAAAE
jgi:Na+/proline symporter/signal transduction histidine kinase